MQEQNQKKVWDSIAAQWYEFRQKPHPQIAAILKDAAEKWRPAKILEIGCGTCRNLLFFSYNNFECYGIDFSTEMLKYAKRYCEKHKIDVKLIKADATKLPFKANTFNYILCISMLHNLDASERKKTLKEIARVLKPEGEAIIAVWNKLQRRFFFSRKDVIIPWHVAGRKLERYYHLFTPFELGRLLKRHGFTITKSNIFGQNLIFVVQK